MIQQANFIYSSLEKVLERQTKVIEIQGRKQINDIRNQTKANWL